MAKRGRPRHPDILTPREWEVLDLIREGLSNEQIASRLNISVDGAKFHVSEILTKLGVPDRLAAARWRPEEERRKWWALAAPLVALRKLRPDHASVAVLASLAVLIIAGSGILVWALVATSNDDDAAANANGSPTDERGRGVWLYHAETGEAELVPFSGYVRFAQWVDDGETFIAQTGGRNDWGLYDTEGNLIRSMIDLPEEIRTGVNLAVTYHAEPIGGGDDILIKRNSEQGFEGTRTWTLFNLGTEEERPLPEFLRDAALISYSPDGTRVAYMQTNAFTWDLVVANADGSEVSILTSGPLQEFPNPAWSPNSSQLLVRIEDVYSVIDLRGEEVWTGPSDSPLRFVWSRPGMLLAILSPPNADDGPRDPGLAIIDVETGMAQPLDERELPPSVLQPYFSPDGRLVITQRRDDRNDFIGFITTLGIDGATSGTTPLRPEIQLPAVVDWTADSSTALLSSP